MIHPHFLIPLSSLYNLQSTFYISVLPEYDQSKKVSPVRSPIVHRRPRWDIRHGEPVDPHRLGQTTEYARGYPIQDIEN